MPTLVVERAADFIWRNARLLERQLFAHLWLDAPCEGVLGALQAYQNADGGFGNALEPDKRCPASQPVDVEMALHILDVVDAVDDLMVDAVLDFLPTITTVAGGVPYALPSILAYPRAPWWQTTADPPASLNPTAAIVGLLLKNNVQHSWLDSATAFCWQEIEQSESEDFHVLMPVITFLEHVADRPRAERELARIGARIVGCKLVAFDATAGYVKGPLDWSPTPQSYCRRLFDDAQIEAALDSLAAQQQPDGGWPINWEPISPAIAFEWRGWTTIGALRTLEAYGR